MRRYKICICSVILGELESFRNYKGFSISFPENYRCNLTYYEGESSTLHHIFESENYRIPFSTKNSLTRGVKCEKSNFAGNLLHNLRKLYNEWNSHLDIFSRPEAILASPNWQMFYKKQSLGSPDNTLRDLHNSSDDAKA